MSKDTTFYSLVVADRVQETPEAVTIYFVIPDDLRDTFNYKAGQYLTLRFMINGKDQRRSYSLCTMPGSEKPGVTVKKVKGGVVSTHVCEKLKAGDMVEVMPPDGKFVVEPDPEARHTYFFFGAGSGITPLMSQIHSILEHEPMSSVHLYYGNRTPDSIIFRDALDKISETYSEQFTVDHIISRPAKTGLLGIFKKKQAVEWLGETGRIDTARVNEFLEKYPARSDSQRYLICGPGDMIECVKSALSSKGIPDDKVLTEYFTPAGDGNAKEVQGIPASSTAMVTLRGEEIELAVAGKTILETLQDAGYDPPFSCTSGACASCMAKVTEGTAEMEMCFALDDSEVAEGFILTCQAHPTSEKIVLSYDV